MYILAFATRAKKSLRKYNRSGSFPIGKFEKALDYLRNGEPLPIFYGDHTLHGELSIYREFHLADDLLVQYKRNEILQVITIAKVGTHTELFGS